MATNDAPQPPRIPTVGEKLGQLDGWESSEVATEGCSADTYSQDHSDHDEDSDCPLCNY